MFFWYIIGAQRLHNGLTMVMQPIWSTLHDLGRFELANKGANEKTSKLELANYYCKLREAVKNYLADFFR